MAIKANEIRKKEKVRDYGSLDLVELKFGEMNREVIRINQIIDSVKRGFTFLVSAINRLAGLVGASSISTESSFNSIAEQKEIIESFVNNQVDKYSELNEFTNERIKELISMVNQLFDADGQLVTYEVNGEEVTESFTTLLKNKEREEKIKTGVALIEMIANFEGTTPIVGDKYKITGDPGNENLLAVGNGLLLGSNAKVFAEHGIYVSQYTYGDLLDISTVNAVRDDVIGNTKEAVVNILEANNITLKDYQIDALTSRMYNTGNINKFVEMYNKYGDTQELYDNWMQYPVYGQNGVYFPSLADRRQKEWNLFHNGIYPEE